MRTVGFDREQVLDAAMRVFWEKGYADASIEDLTQATGLRRSSLYNTFAGKRELYLAAMHRYYDQCTQQYAALDSAADPVQGIAALVESVIAEELSDTRGMGCLVANAALEFSGRDEVVQQATGRNLATMAEAIQAAIARAQRMGLAAATVDARATAQTIVVMIQGLRVAGKGIPAKDRPAWLNAAATSCLAVLHQK